MKTTYVKILPLRTSCWFGEHIGETFEVYTIKESNRRLKSYFFNYYCYILVKDETKLIYQRNCIDIKMDRKQKLNKICSKSEI